MKKLTFAAKILARIVFIGLGILLVLTALVVIIFWRLDQTNGRLISSGQERKYLLYVPDSYDPSTPTPLVISIHGYAEWPAHQMELSGWNSLADENGFIVVYPSGTGFPRRWRLNAPAGTEDDPMLDVQFISDLIDHLGREYNLDPERIYANGLSNGGGMSALLACTLSDRIAAVGSVSGAHLFPPADCTPSRPAPLIAFHGTADKIVPYQGGPSSSFALPFPVVQDWIQGWAQQNGCLTGPVELPCSGEVCGVRYTDCQDGAEVILYTIQKGGHSWPGGEPMPAWIVGHTSADIDATAVMWEYFSRFSLSANSR